MRKKRITLLCSYRWMMWARDSLKYDGDTGELQKMACLKDRKIG